MLHKGVPTAFMLRPKNNLEQVKEKVAMPALFLSLPPEKEYCRSQCGRQLQRWSSDCRERTGCQVGTEELPEVSLGGVAGEHVLDGVLEGKVEGLCGEVSDDIRQVATPEGGEALLCRHAPEAVHNACMHARSSAWLVRAAHEAVHACKP